MSETQLTVRVYYEDTDAGGLTYYANYLRFLERARTEMLRSLGISQQALIEKNIAFAVRSVQAEYLKPARLDDELVVFSRIESLGRAQLMFSQCIKRGEEHLLDAKIRVACIDPLAGKPIPMPRDLHAQLLSLMEASA
jgi:tol-pal system-associated acyl-CoA thioesterase